MRDQELIDMFDDMILELSSFTDLIEIFDKMIGKELVISNIDLTPFTIDWNSFNMLEKLKEFTSKLRPHPFFKIIDQFTMKDTWFIFGIPYTQDHPAEYFIYQSTYEKILLDDISKVFFDTKMKYLDTFNWSNLGIKRIAGGTFKNIKHEYLFTINIQDIIPDAYPFLKHLQFRGSDYQEYYFSLEKEISDMDFIKNFIHELESSLTSSTLQDRYYQWNLLLKNILDLPLILKFYVENMLNDF